MKITIDTQTDTYEDIKKVLHLLTGIIEHKESAVPGANVDTANLMSMFSDEGKGSDSSGPASPLGQLLGSAVSPAKEEKKEEPQLEFY